MNILKWFNDNHPKKYKEKSYEDFQKDLLKHPIFNELETWEEIKVHNLDIDDMAKKRMADCYLSILFEEISKTLTNIVKNYEHYTENTSEIFSDLVNTTIVVRRIAASKGVPNIFLVKFTDRLYKDIQVITNTINELKQTNMYETPNDRMISFLDVGLMYIRLSVITLEDTINGMNGKLHAALSGSIFDKE